MKQKDARKFNRTQFHIHFGSRQTEVTVALRRPNSPVIESVLTDMGWTDEFTSPTIAVMAGSDADLELRTLIRDWMAERGFTDEFSS